MDEKELQKCIWQLSARWKDHFGLYTYYVGYLTADMFLTLLSVWRESDPAEVDGLDGKEILSLINDKAMLLNESENTNLVPFPADKNIETVMRKLIDELENFDLSESNLEAGKWDAFVEYLSAKKNQ